MFLRASAAALFAFMACLVSSPSRAEGVAAASIGKRPAPTLKTELEAGYRLREQERTEEALAAFKGVLKKDPTNHAALIEVGYLHGALKQYRSAVKHLRAASTQDPSDMQLQMDLGYFHDALKEHAAARERFSKVAASPGRFQAQAEEALKALPEVAAPASASALQQRRLREQGYAALARRQRVAARKAFEAAVANDPEDQVSRKQLGYLKAADGDLAAAAAEFEAVRAQSPGDHAAVLQLGYLYERLKKKEAAAAAFQTASASVDPTIRDAARAALEATRDSQAQATP